MIKVNILNLTGFLDTINQCRGHVSMLAPDGAKVNITRQYGVQHELAKQYQKNGKSLPLTLFFEEPKDYLAVVSYYACLLYCLWEDFSSCCNRKITAGTAAFSRNRI